ncbi:MAG: hypothetical protein HKN77_06585 [Woeseiaceae bacterium]|nr:hypothetical protein [Woeseiaceae bacterium]
MKTAQFQSYARLAFTAILVAWMAAVPLYAGDEDMSPNAYHVFDPETGYMMTVEPMTEEELAQARAEHDNDGDVIASGERPSDAAIPVSWLVLLAIVFAAIAYFSWHRFVRGRQAKA